MKITRNVRKGLILALISVLFLKFRCKYSSSNLPSTLVPEEDVKKNKNITYERDSRSENMLTKEKEQKGEKHREHIALVLICAIDSNNAPSLNAELHWHTIHLSNNLDSIFGRTRNLTLVIYILTFKKDFLFLQDYLKDLIADGRKYRNIESMFSFIAIEEVTNQHSFEIERMRRFYSNISVLPRYDKPYFYFRPLYHEIFKAEKTLISLDLDVELRSDIKILQNEFNRMERDNMIAIAYELSPYYREAFRNYRLRNKGTAIGSPRPGFQGFNTGVVLFDLQKMRRSKKYKYFLSEEGAMFLKRKYKMDAFMGDQDLFTLIGAEEPKFFRVLNCNWNKQLSTEWLSDSEFNIYRNCSEPVNVYHGNSGSSIPDE